VGPFKARLIKRGAENLAARSTAGQLPSGEFNGIILVVQSFSDPSIPKVA